MTVTVSTFPVSSIPASVAISPSVTEAVIVPVVRSARSFTSDTEAVPELTVIASDPKPDKPSEA